MKLFSYDDRVVPFPSRRARQACEAEVLLAASAIERDRAAMLAWYRDDPIASLGGYTAQALVEAGRHHQVLSFLRRARTEH